MGNQSMKLCGKEEDEFDVPSENSTNCVSKFSTNTNKLVFDKGSVKACDIEIFKSEVYHNPKISAKLPYLKSSTMKGMKEATRPNMARHKSHIVGDPDKKRFQMMGTLNNQELSRLDSPDILK